MWWHSCCRVPVQAPSRMRGSTGCLSITRWLCSAPVRMRMPGSTCSSSIKTGTTQTSPTNPAVISPSYCLIYHTAGGACISYAICISYHKIIAVHWLVEKCWFKFKQLKSGTFYPVLHRCNYLKYNDLGKYKFGVFAYMNKLVKHVLHIY